MADAFRAPASSASRPVATSGFDIVRSHDMPPALSSHPSQAANAVPASSLSASVEDLVELGVHGVDVGLVTDRVLQRCDERQVGVGRVVGAAPLATVAGQSGADRLDQAAVRVGGDQGDPRKQDHAVAASRHNPTRTSTRNAAPLPWMQLATREAVHGSPRAIGSAPTKLRV
jgi:hypothetical protein